MAGPPTLAEAKAALNMSSSVNDAEVTRFLAAASEAVEAIVGPVAEREIIEEHHSGLEWNRYTEGSVSGASLVLRVTPVVSVTAIHSLYDETLLWGPADLAVDKVSGIVRLRGGVQLWLPGAGVRATYQAGRTDVPESIRTAILIILDHLYKQQRGWGGGRVGMRGEELGESDVPLGFALPSRAVQLLEPYRVQVVA